MTECKVSGRQVKVLLDSEGTSVSKFGIKAAQWYHTFSTGRVIAVPTPLPFSSLVWPTLDVGTSQVRGGDIGKVAQVRLNHVPETARTLAPCG